MKLHEKQLKMIIKRIEKYAVVDKIEILNTEISIPIPGVNKVVGIDLNKPLKYSIAFTLGDKKEQKSIPLSGNSVN